MSPSLWRNRSGWLILGLIVGLLIGSSLPYSPAHAVATDRFDNFAICTGQVTQGLEALYVLDFLTGQLKAGVLSPQSGKFSALYVRDIGRDLGVNPQQNPKFLMVSGDAQIQARGAGMNRGTSSVLYVAELSTGRIGVYTIPWSGQILNSTVNAPLILLDMQQFRDAGLIRDPQAGAANPVLPNKN